MNEDNEKPPLEYRNYSDDFPERKRNAGAFILGMLPGILLTVAFGCFNFTLHLALSERAAQNPTTPVPRGENTNLVVVFACVVVLSAVLGAFTLRGPRRRFMLAGFLLGIALTCLIEGICFFE